MSLHPQQVIEPGGDETSASARRTRVIHPIAIAVVSGVVTSGSVYAVMARELNESGHPRRSAPVVVSGTAGLREAPSGAHERWGSAPVTITLDPSLDALDPGAKEGVRNAFGTWLSTGIALPALTFIRAASPWRHSKTALMRSSLLRSTSRDKRMP